MHAVGYVGRVRGMLCHQPMATRYQALSTPRDCPGNVARARPTAVARGPSHLSHHHTASKHLLALQEATPVQYSFIGQDELFCDCGIEIDLTRSGCHQRIGIPLYTRDENGLWQDGESLKAWEVGRKRWRRGYAEQGWRPGVALRVSPIRPRIGMAPEPQPASISDIHSSTV